MKKILFTLGLLLASTLSLAQGGGQFGSGSTGTSLPSLSDSGSLVSSTSGLTFTGAQGAATTISTSTTNAGIFITPNGTGAVGFNAGTATNPAIQLNGMGATTGVFGGATSFGFSSSGTGVAGWVSAGASAGSGKGFCISSTTIFTGAVDICATRIAPGFMAIGTLTAGNTTGFHKTAQTLQVITADVTCGTGGTLAPCTSLTTITGLTATLPLIAANWSFICDLIVSQVTATAADQIGVQTATNGATNLTASGEAYTAAATVADGSLTDVASTTTSQSIITFTPGATGTKVPIHIAGTIEGTSASGTIFNLQVLTGAAADLLTIYRGSSCWLF